MSLNVTPSIRECGNCYHWRINQELDMVTCWLDHDMGYKDVSDNIPYPSDDSCICHATLNEFLEVMRKELGETTGWLQDDERLLDKAEKIVNGVFHDMETTGTVENVEIQKLYRIIRFRGTERGEF